MRRQPAIAYMCDMGMPLQPMRQRQCIDVDLVHAERKRAQAAQQQPRVKWCERPSERQQCFPPLVYRVLTTANHTRSKVTVATKVLGGTMYHDVDTEVSRPLVDGAGEGVIADGRNAALPRHIAYIRQVGYRQIRVGWRFKINQRRMVAHGAVKRRVVALVEERYLHTELW